MNNEIMIQAAKLLRDIDKFGGLKQGGEQYPNGLNCHDIADQLEAEAKLRAKDAELINAISEQLSATQAREAMLVDWVNRSEHLHGCSDSGTRPCDCGRDSTLSNSTEHRERFMEEVKAKTLEDAADEIHKDALAHVLKWEKIDSEYLDDAKAAAWSMEQMEVKLRRMANELREVK